MMIETVKIVSPVTAEIRTAMWSSTRAIWPSITKFSESRKRNCRFKRPCFHLSLNRSRNNGAYRRPNDRHSSLHGIRTFRDNQTVSENLDIVYLVFGMRQMSLYERLTTLSASEEAVLVTTYLTNLYTLETAIVGASANLDTEAASVWTWNKNEVGDRVGLFNKWRRELCNFLGAAPGPGLGSGMSISRA